MEFLGPVDNNWKRNHTAWEAIRRYDKAKGDIMRRIPEWLTKTGGYISAFIAEADKLRRELVKRAGEGR